MATAPQVLAMCATRRDVRDNGDGTITMIEGDASSGAEASLPADFSFSGAPGRSRTSDTRFWETGRGREQRLCQDAPVKCPVHA